MDYPYYNKTEIEQAMAKALKEFKNKEIMKPGVRVLVKLLYNGEVIEVAGTILKRSYRDNTYGVKLDDYAKNMFTVNGLYYVDRERLRLYVNDSLCIKNVIFNDPATIVFWEDGTKTVVKVQGSDEFDPEKGLAMAIAKKALGNQGNYYNRLKPWLEKYEMQSQISKHDMEIIRKLIESLSNKGL